MGRNAVCSYKVMAICILSVIKKYKTSQPLLSGSRMALPWALSLQRKATVVRKSLTCPRVESYLSLVSGHHVQFMETFCISDYSSVFGRIANQSLTLNLL